MQITIFHLHQYITAICASVSSVADSPCQHDSYAMAHGLLNK